MTGRRRPIPSTLALERADRMLVGERVAIAVELDAAFREGYGAALARLEFELYSGVPLERALIRALATSDERL